MQALLLHEESTMDDFGCVLPSNGSILSFVWCTLPPSSEDGREYHRREYIGRDKATSQCHVKRSRLHHFAMKIRKDDLQCRARQPCSYSGSKPATTAGEMRRWWKICALSTPGVTSFASLVSGTDCGLCRNTVVNIDKMQGV